MRPSAASPAAPLVSSPARRRPSLFLLYHELTPETTSYGYALHTDTFHEHLALYTRVRANEAEGVPCPEITFDDGHRSNFEQALPSLTKSGWRARFFITAGWTGTRAGYMNWDQLRQIAAAGHTLGAHGWSHKLLTHCTPAELDTELRKARETLEDRIGVAITTLSLPGGRFDARVLEACAAAGYSQVFSSIPQAEPTATGSLLGRVNLRSDVSIARLESLLQAGSPALLRLRQRQRWKEAAQRMVGDGLYAKLWVLLNRAPADAL